MPAIIHALSCSAVRRPVYCFLALAVGMSTGCALTTHPLTDAKTSKPDLRLLGTWEFTPPDESAKKMTIVVTRKKDAPNVLVATMTEGEKKEEAEVFTTKIGDEYFASVQTDDANKAKIYQIIKYKIGDGDNAKFAALDRAHFKAAVESKELKGTVSPELLGNVTIDLSSEELAAYLKKNAAKCFGAEEEYPLKQTKKGE